MMADKNEKDIKCIYDDIVGFRELRNNISLVMDNVMNDYQVVLSGNVKKSRSGSATIISSDILNEILSVYKFEPVVSYDKGTRQYEIMIDKIGIYGTGASKDEAISNTVDMVVDIADDYFKNVGIYARIPGEKEKYPYFLRIKNCRNKDDVIRILDLV